MSETNRKEEMRKKILDAAFSLFMEKGYKDTKIADIADRAEIGKGTVYDYFAGKETLFSQLFHQRIADNHKQLEKIRTSEASSQEKLLAYFRLEADNAKKFKKGKAMFPKLTMESELFQNKNIRRDLNDLLYQKYMLIDEIIRQGVLAGEFSVDDADITATALMGAVHFYVSFYYGLLPDCFFQKLPPSHWDEDMLLRLFLDGMKKGE